MSSPPRALPCLLAAVALPLALAAASCSDQAEVTRSSASGGVAGAAGAAGAAGTPAAGGSAGAGAAAADILRRDGTRIVDGRGDEVWLRGVAFGNEVWSDNPYPDTHHDERDFERVAAMNMNAVRFYMNYQTFEDDTAPYEYKPEGWAWIDQNVQWAREHGIYLILNMHAPQGGYQSQGEGTALWTDPENQNRLSALWRAIAERYANEPAIAAFDLVNEPVVTESLDQWQELAERLVAEIRTVNDQHLIAVERLNAIGDDWGFSPEQSFFLVDDDNILYEFHFYSPHDFTHQLLDWGHPGEGGPYPDESRFQIDWTHMEWRHWTYDAVPDAGRLRLPDGDTSWTEYSFRYTVDDPTYEVGIPVLMSQNNTGTAYFDDIVINEYDAGGALVREVTRLELESTTSWSLWEDGAGTGDLALSSDSHQGSYSLTLSGTTTNASASCGDCAFLTTPGYTYEVTGWMRGDASQPGSQTLLRLDFYEYTAELVARNRAFLEAELGGFLDWGESHGVPVYLGEFGTNSHTFQNDRGGLRWVGDVLDIVQGRGAHFTYHAYHEDAFGIYYGYGTLPDPSNANQELIDLLTERLQ